MKFLNGMKYAIRSAQTSDILLSWSFWMIAFAVVSYYFGVLRFAFAFGVVAIITAIVSVVFVEKEKRRDRKINRIAGTQ